MKLRLGLAALVLVGCQSSPLERELLNDQLDYARVSELVQGHARPSFEVSDQPLSLDLSQVRRLTCQYNYSILSAREGYRSARYRLERERVEWWDPRVFSNTDLGAQESDFRDLVTRNRSGAQVTLPDGSRVQVFAENSWFREPVDERFRAHRAGARLEVPVPFLNPAYWSRQVRIFKSQMDYSKAENGFRGQVRDNVLSSINQYIKAREYFEEIRLYDAYVGRLESLRPLLSQEDRGQLETDVSNAQASRRGKQVSYQNQLLSLNGQLGIPLEQAIETGQALSFSFEEPGDGLLSRVVANDYSTINLVLDLAYAQRQLNEAEQDFGLRPLLFFESGTGFRGEPDFAVGFKLEFRFGQTARRGEVAHRMSSLQYQIQSRRQALDTQVRGLVRQLRNQGENVEQFSRTSEQTERTLAAAERRLRAGRATYTELRPLLQNWLDARQQLIDSKSYGMTLDFQRRALLGELDQTE